MMLVLTGALWALVLGGLVYFVLTVIAARNWLNQRRGEAATQPVSILKPLSGADLGLYDNLRSFFAQDYPDFEILCAVREAGDPAVAVVEKLRAEFPAVPCRLLITGEPPWPNAKVFSLENMLAEARHDLLVMADSDVRFAPRDLRAIAAEFADQKVALVTCPYRAVAGASFWSRLEAAGMNTDFLGGVLVARMMDGMKFALGPTIACRHSVLRSVGSMRAFCDYLAEDFVLGQTVAAAGHAVLLSRTVVEHHIGSDPFVKNALHRLRWNRSTRRSRPFGYLGLAFTNPLPISLLLCMVQHAAWPVLIPTLLLRAAAAWAVCRRGMNARVPWLLVALDDIAGFLFWIGGFFGNTVVWRGRRYRVDAQGRFVPLTVDAPAERAGSPPPARD